MNRRKRKLIRLDLQLKIVFITLFVAALVLLINLQLTLAGLWSLSNQFLANQRTETLLEALRTSTIHKFLISVGMAVPLAAAVGILYSFKFSGPIYRFKRYFTDLTRGRWDERCMLRRGDDLQDVCEAINQGLEAIRIRLRRNHALFQDVRAYLEAAPEPGDPGAEALRKKILAGLTEEARVHAARFGVPTGAAVEPAPCGASSGDGERAGEAAAAGEESRARSHEAQEETDRELEPQS